MDKKQEEKQLLLKDICARLPNGVICVTTSIYYDDNDNEIGQAQGRLVSINRHGATFVDDRDNTTFEADFEDDGQIGFKPYLRPMSSMTDEEVEKYNDLVNELSEYNCLPVQSASKMINWLNTHRFDYRGLIPMGLALEAPENMYK